MPSPENPYDMPLTPPKHVMFRLKPIKEDLAENEPGLIKEVPEPSRLAVPVHRNQGSSTTTIQVTPVQSAPNSARSTDDVTGDEDKSWVPYEHVWTDTPFLAFAKGCVRKWNIFRQRIFKNHYMHGRFPIPCMKGIFHKLRSVYQETRFAREMIVFLFWLIGTATVLFLALKYYWTVKLSATAAAIPTALVFALCMRNSFFTFLFGIPFERQLFWHKLMAYSAVSIGLVHGYLAMDRNSSMTYMKNVSGIILGASMVLILVCTIPPIRRRFFNLFHALHIILFVVATGAGIWHGAKGIYFGLAFYVFDILMRFVYLTLIRNPKSCSATVLPSNVMRLKFPKGKFEYCSGQYVFLMIPQINIFEWHPFSISSAPHHDQVSIHIRAVGNWTSKLLDILTEATQKPSVGSVNFRKKEIELKMYVDGPYGSPEIDLDSDRYKLFLLISGGIGITPMQSVCNQLVHEHEDLGRPMKKVVFIWSCADKFMVSSAFERDREWAKGKARSSFKTRLPVAFQPQVDTLRRFSVDPSFLKRESTFKKVRLRPETGLTRENTIYSTLGIPKTEVDILHTEFYLTREDTEDFNSRDVRGELLPYVKFGRPNYPEILVTMRYFAIQSREKNIGIIRKLCHLLKHHLSKFTCRKWR